ncbi:MAG: TRAP-type C4-dicarboxylate transport system, DctM subunit [Chloroflexi bacterium]|nr:TRAP-type C4-dicarboxylate transport system, DctM subunit [Chloroflexota bacterium]
MDSVTIGLIGIVVLVILFFLRMPIAFAMLFCGAVGFVILKGPTAGLSLLGSELYDQFGNYNFTVIPMFVLAGSIAYVSGVGERLFIAASGLLRKLPGGLAVAATAACAGFSAICGSSAATAAAMGKISIPAMRQFNYDDALSTGTVAAAGTLGVLIPPSTVFITYGILTQTSIGKLFVSGILPGIMLAIMIIITVVIICLIKPGLAPVSPPVSARKMWEGAAGIIEVVVLFVMVIGGLGIGLFSATQAGAISAAGVFVVALARRKLSWDGLVAAFKDSAKLSCMIMFIMVAALIFGRFIAVSRVPIELSNWMNGLNVSPLVIVVLIMVAYSIGGMFMDGLALVTLTIPIIWPTMLAMNIDPIWFGCLIVLVGEQGMITPPVGINVFVIKGIAPDVPMGTIFKGILPFVATITAALVIILFVPVIATFLPQFMTY